MSSTIIISVIFCYLAVLFVISYLSSRKSDNEGFFVGNRRNGWALTTLAMIGAAMSGVTFVSVPGTVSADSFSYMQMVIGFTIGQLIVAFLLVPLFYRRGVLSLYQYLEERYGSTTHRTGAWCFLIAKVITASLKIYVITAMMQLLLFEQMGIPFALNVVATMFMVWLYTQWGGVRSLIPTDTLQSLCLIAAVISAIWAICHTMGLSLGESYNLIAASPESQMFFFDDAASPLYFWKMVAGGALCLVAMTGLDQDMMQRNLSCRTVRDSQINIVLTAICQAVVILLFLSLGILLNRYIDFTDMPVPERGDDIFATVAVQGGLPLIVGITFIVGLISSTYSAAGSALTSLTTSFTLDILPFSRERSERELRRLRQRVHIAMAGVMTLFVFLFAAINNDGVINLVFRIAGYTYGPILGLFTFGILSHRSVNERYVPTVVIAAPLLSFALQWAAARFFCYYIGFELLGYNALFVTFGLWLLSRRATKNVMANKQDF